jgi:hypothetical protein
MRTAGGMPAIRNTYLQVRRGGFKQILLLSLFQTKAPCYRAEKHHGKLAANAMPQHNSRVQLLQYVNQRHTLVQLQIKHQSKRLAQWLIQQPVRASLNVLRQRLARRSVG